MGCPRILICESEHLVALDLQILLSLQGYFRPLTVCSGPALVSEANRMGALLILTEIKLPGTMDGIEAAREIRSVHDIPVVYLTTCSDAATVQRAKETNPYGYLLKPFSELQLLITVELALHRHEMEKQLRLGPLAPNPMTDPKSARA